MRGHDHPGLAWADGDQILMTDAWLGGSGLAWLPQGGTILACARALLEAAGEIDEISPALAFEVTAFCAFAVVDPSVSPARGGEDQDVVRLSRALAAGLTDLDHDLILRVAEYELISDQGLALAAALETILEARRATRHAKTYPPVHDVDPMLVARWMTALVAFTA